MIVSISANISTNSSNTCTNDNVENTEGKLNFFDDYIYVTYTI